MYLYGMVWNGVIGQSRLIKQLEYLITSDTIPHAQLISGAPGYGTLALALAFSEKIVTAKKENRTALHPHYYDPDLHFVYPVVKRGNEKNVFSSDYSAEWHAFIAASSYVSYNDWFTAISVGNKQGLINVAEIEKLHQKMHLKAFSGNNKVCVIWGAEKMNSSASNAFLKLLEEPPKKTYFILIAEDVEEVLPTLISRCQHIALGPIDTASLLEHFPGEAEHKTHWVTLANGDYNRLNHLINTPNKKDYERLLVLGLRTAFKARGNAKVVLDLMDWSQQLSTMGREDQKDFLAFGIQFFRDAFFLNYKLDSIVYYQSETDFDLNKFAPFVHANNAKILIDLFEDSYRYIQRNGNAKMVFTELSLQMTRLLNSA